MSRPGWRVSSIVCFADWVPTHWCDMKQHDVCLVELPPGHAEYDKVANVFKQTCPNFKIEKVSLLVAWSFLVVEVSGIVVLDTCILIHFLTYF